jgi:hypothetical protein
MSAASLRSPNTNGNPNPMQQHERTWSPYILESVAPAIIASPLRTNCEIANAFGIRRETVRRLRTYLAAAGHPVKSRR